MVDVRTAGHLEFHTKPRIFVAGSAGVRRTQFAASFPKPIVADCGANQSELALSGADYAIINSESDLFDLVLELEGDTSYQTLVLDALDGFQDVLLDERLETEHRNELEVGDWKWLEGRLRTIFKRLKTLPQNLVVVGSVRDTMVRDTTVFQPVIQGGFAYKISQYMTHMLWLRANTVDGEYPREDFYLLTRPVSEAEWVGDFTQSLPRIFPVDFKSDFDRITEFWSNVVVGESVDVSLDIPPDVSGDIQTDISGDVSGDTEIPGQLSISDALESEAEPEVSGDVVESVSQSSCTVCGADVSKVWADLSVLRFGELHCESCFKKLN